MNKKTTREHSLTLHDPQVELWHREGGNPMFTKFCMPIGARQELVEREFLRVGKIWLSNMAKDGWNAEGGTVQCLGPYPILEYDSLDLCAFYIGAMFTRRRPQVLTLDDARVVEETPEVTRPGRDFRNFLDSLRRLGRSAVEQQVTQAREIDRRVGEEIALRKEVNRDNETRGLRRIGGE